MNINWHVFNAKNPRYEDAFEEMCLHLFCRDHKIDAHKFKANFNQTGLEIEPWNFEGKYYGFQSKYITGSGTDFYAQVNSSLSKAVDIYKDTIDVIFVYTNNNIKPNVTEAEMNTYKKSRSQKKKSHRKELKILEEKYNVEIRYITEPNFKVLLTKPENVDLYRKFFSPEKESDFLDNILSNSERTFLRSNQFMDLTLNGTRFSEQKEKVLDQASLIIGHAGTGKTELMKSLFLQCEENFLQIKNNNVPIPVFIRLRECVGGNLEDLIRHRLFDYHIKFDNNHVYIYFLDGVDEIYDSYGSVFFSQVKRLKQESQTKQIIFSSRPNSANLLFLRNIFNPVIYQIDPLDKENIKKYFDLQNSKYEEIESFPIIGNIDDILSIALLHQNANLLDKYTTRIDLVKYNIRTMISTNSELKKLDIPMPYIESITNILKAIAISMHRSRAITITLFKVQSIVHEIYSKLSYKEVDSTISYISGLFFDYSTDITENIIYSFRHKRYFEYFLYLHVSDCFYENPFILRDEALLTNKDFMINLFLTQEIKTHTLTKDILKVVTLRFCEDYLGDSYIGRYRNEWVGQRKSPHVANSDYLTSTEYLAYLCQKDKSEIKTYLTLNLDMISSFLTSKNYWEFIAMYHKRNNYDIRELMNSVLGNSDIIIKVNNNNIGDMLYCKIMFSEEGTDIDKLYAMYVDNIDFKNLDNNLESNDMYLKNELNPIVSFFDIALKYLSEWLINNVNRFSLESLEVLCYCILQKRNLKVLLSENQLLKTVLNRIEVNPNDNFRLYTKILYRTKHREDIKYSEDLEERLNSVNSNHYEKWRTGLDANNFCAALNTKEDFKIASKEYSLGVSLTIILLRNLEEKDIVLGKIIDEIRKYNFINHNSFSYENAIYIGNIICSFAFDINEIKIFFKDLSNYENVVPSFTVLYTIFSLNTDLFKIIASKKHLKIAYDYNLNQLSYYDCLSDINFQYATMLSVFDKKESENICLQGISNSILRPIYRKETLIKYTLPKCLEIAAINQWFTSENLEYMCYRNWYMLKIAEETLDSGACLGFLREVVQNYLPDSELSEKLQDYETDSHCQPFEDNNFSSFDLSSVNVSNLEDYYQCKVKNIQYNNFTIWKQLIIYEYSIDPELKILYKTLERNFFPKGNFGKTSHYYKYIVAILFENFDTREKIIDLIMSLARRDTIPLMINVFSLTGDDEKGKSLTETLVLLCETLVCIEPPQKITLDVGSCRYKIMKEIYASSFNDWVYDEENQKMIYVNNTEISISWDDDSDDFHEDWATSHINSHAKKRNYSILLKDVVIDTVSLVFVDGSRGLIPMPKINTNIVSRNEYNFALLINKDDKSVNEYIIRSRLVVN